MRKLFLLTALVIAALQLTAANVDQATAQQVAQRFMMSHATANGRFMASAPTVKWTHAEKNSSMVNQASYYIVNTDRGYVIVSGDDRAKEVLAYGEGSLSSINDLPDAVQYFLDIYQKQIEYLQAHPGMMVQKRSATRGMSVEPLLKTCWAQDKPYNMRCPKVGRNYCKVGCTAVALAQVIRYWKYPQTGPAMEAYTSPKTGITASALPGCTFDWANMRDTYEGLSNSYIENNLPEYEIDAIGNLMRYVGQAEKVHYNVDQTGTENMGILGAIQLFGFDPGARLVKKCDSPDDEDELHAGAFTEEEYYNYEQWGQIIQAELRAGRPLVYCAYNMSSDSSSINGHAFNVDGYDADNDTYHVNFGMSSEKNNYFALDAFDAGSMVVYDFWPIFFAGVQPPGLSTEPRILVSPDELNMECYAGEDTTATFSVVGERLSGDITVAINDADGVFTVDATTIAVVDSFANVTVTVTYAPQAAGTHNATITLSSDGVESKVVTLKGTATNAPLVLYDPVMLPADSAYINLTSFRADWTDQTVPQNVLSYTLEVNEKPVYNYLAAADWSNTPEVFSNQADSWQTSGLIPEGWSFTGSSLWAEDHFISMQNASITTPDFTGCDKVTVVLTAMGVYGVAPFSVSTNDATSYGPYYYSNSAPRTFTQFVITLDCQPTDHVTINSYSNYLGLLDVTVYAGEVSAPETRALVEEDTESHKLISGITDKFYTVTGLKAEGTYSYKVKAFYADGTESPWSNTEEVTLFANTPAFAMGDVNHDTHVDIDDITALIARVLGDTPDEFYEDQANVDGQGGIDIDDVTALITIVLGGH